MSSDGEAKSSDRLIRRLLNKRKPKAREYMDDPTKLGDFISQVGKKVDERAGNRGPLEEVWDYLTLLPRLIRAYLRREYTEVPVKSVVLIIAALIYLVNPFDLVPDVIPAGGYIDDAAVIAFVIRQVKIELDKFRAWETVRNTTVQV